MYADAGEIGPKPRLHVSTHTVRKGTATSFTLIDLSFDIICRLKAFSQSTGGFDLDRFGFFRGTLGLSQRGHRAGYGKKIAWMCSSSSGESSLLGVCCCGTKRVIEAARGLGCGARSLSSPAEMARCIEYAAAASDVFIT